jgi:hypothetical protein
MGDLLKIETSLKDMEGDGCWLEVFKYAGTSAGEYSDPPSPPENVKTGAVIGVHVDVSPFGIHDIKELLGSVEGDNDGPDWVAVMELKDGRFACVRAGCDYTGWG